MHWPDFKFPPINLHVMNMIDNIVSFDSTYIYDKRTLLIKFNTIENMKKFEELLEMRKNG
jgi:hypothetical protein